MARSRRRTNSRTRTRAEQYTPYHPIDYPKPQRKIIRKPQRTEPGTSNVFKVADAQKTLRKTVPGLLYTKPKRAETRVKEKPIVKTTGVKTTNEQKTLKQRFCKQRPEKTKASGGSRPYVPWCNK